MMKELVKVISKKLCVYSLVFNTAYSIADYGMSFIIAYFATTIFCYDEFIKASNNKGFLLQTI